MNAGVWSHADVKRGRVILLVLSVLVLAKEGTVLGLEYFSRAVIDQGWLTGQGAWPGDDKGWLLFGLKVAALFLALQRQHLARLLLGLIYLTTAGTAIVHILAAGTPLGALDCNGKLSLINAGLGVGISLLLWLIPQLRAYEQAYGPGRVTVSIIEGGSQRREGVGRSLGAFLGRLLQLLPGLGLLVVFAYAMNLHVLIRQWLLPIFGH